MRSHRLLAACALSALVLAPVSAYAESGPDIFKASGCSACHSVTVASIALDPDGEFHKDLSKIGSDHDKKRIAGWLLQLTPNGKGELHKKKFQGPKASLKILCEWLETLK